MTHSLINMGASWRCLHCGVVWDQGDDVENPCPGLEMTRPSPPAGASFQNGGPATEPGSTTPASGALAVQHGGSHYKGLVIQPTEFAQKNRLDFCVGSTLKYLTRWRAKNGLEDLRKAAHFVEIREALLGEIERPRHQKISMEEYLRRNCIPQTDHNALLLLRDYYEQRGELRYLASQLIDAIHLMIDRAHGHEG